MASKLALRLEISHSNSLPYNYSPNQNSKIIGVHVNENSTVENVCQLAVEFWRSVVNPVVDSQPLEVKIIRWQKVDQNRTKLVRDVLNSEGTTDLNSSNFRWKIVLADHSSDTVGSTPTILWLSNELMRAISDFLLEESILKCSATCATFRHILFIDFWKSLRLDAVVSQKVYAKINEVMRNHSALQSFRTYNRNVTLRSSSVIALGAVTESEAIFAMECIGDKVKSFEFLSDLSSDSHLLFEFMTRKLPACRETLKSLYLYVDGDAVNFLKRCLPLFIKLEELTLEGLTMYGGDLLAIPNLPRLKRITLSFIGEQGDEELLETVSESLIDCPSLRDRIGRNVETRGGETAAEMGEKFETKFFKSLAVGIRRGVALEELKCPGLNRKYRADAERLGQALSKNLKVSKLDLSTDEELYEESRKEYFGKVFEGLTINTTLRDLICHRANFSKESIELLVKMIKVNKGLRLLDLDFCSFDGPLKDIFLSLSANTT